MAKFKVEIKSKDMIKPFSETPNHLKTLRLSFIDQFGPPAFMPFIFYYQTPFNHNNNSQTTTLLLKKSLSETLVQFYPLAGRVEGNLSINCNDEGVEFYEANVLASLAEVIASPDPEELIRLLPYAPNAPVSNNICIVTAVQVSRFSCGSIAISVCISHKIGDAATDIAFINAWARNTRDVSDNNHKLVTFDSTAFVSPMDLNGIYDPKCAICKERIVTRRLIFDKEKLDELKKKYDDGKGRLPSRVTVVYALLWNKLIKIARAKPTPPEICSAALALNLRAIRNSTIPENCYGNLSWTTLAHTQIKTEDTETVGKLRTALEKIDTSLLRKIKTGECFLEIQEAYKGLSQGGEIYNCGFSSLTKFPLYEVNFGWGTPIWVSQTTMPFINTVFLFSTKCGQGIEAWVNVLEEDVAMFDQDHEIQSLASQHMRPKL